MLSHSRTVVVVGGGIVGPVLALLLKQKGWDPVVVEKVKDVGESGLAIAIHPNGLKVLNTARVAGPLLEGTLPWLKWQEFTSNGEYLGGPGCDLPSTWVDKYGWPAIGISRTRIQLCLRDIVQQHGIQYLQGWSLKGIREKENSVVAVNTEGQELEAAFIVGCDGLKSMTRHVLMGKKGIDNTDPNFTGIAVMGGVCPTPAFQQQNQGVNNWYGPATCVISHPLENGNSVWGLNYVPAGAVAESWRTVPQAEMQGQISQLLEQFEAWPGPVSEMIAKSTKIQKIGLYDRPELATENWYHNRIMLIGDAAHPTTPHIGQGANQGLEDCWTLVQNLPAYSDQVHPQQLTDAFSATAKDRQPKTTAVVNAARAAGENRVVRGGEGDVEGRRKRDELVRSSWQDVEMLQKIQDGFYQGPFDDPTGYKDLLE